MGDEKVRSRLKRGGETIRFHRVADGEIVVADGSCVLEMFLGGSVGMIIYDRGRRLAAASKLALAPGGGALRSIEERTSAACLALLTRLARRGCDPEALEIFALGAQAGDGWPARLAVRGASRISLAVDSWGREATRRVEFDVGLGRIVIEQGAC